MDLIGFFMATSFTQAFGVYGIDLLPLTIRSEAQKPLLIYVIYLYKYLLDIKVIYFDF